MNKKLSIVLIVLLSVLLFLVIGVMIFLMNTNVTSIGFSFGTIGIHTGLSTKLVEEKEITNIKPIKIEFDASDVNIKTSETDSIKVELYGEDPGEYEITELEDSIKIVLKEKENNKVKWGWNIKQNNIKVYIPANYAYLIDAKGTAGDIYMDDFSSASFNAELTSGDVEIKEANNINISVRSGDIEIGSAYEVTTNSTSGDVEVGTVRKLETVTTTGDIDADQVDFIKAKTTTGDFTIGYVMDTLDVETTTGDIRVENANILHNSKIKATTGDVTVNNLNDNVYASGDASTGDVRIKKTDRKADVELTIKTTTGDIIVK